MKVKMFWLFALFFLGGCASNLPIEITSPIESSPSLSEARQDIESHQGKLVRWGGSIAAVENKNDETWLEVVSRKLNSNGKPQKSDQTEGRFLLKVSQFLEPEVYSKGRLITVYGSIIGEQEGNIGEQPYRFPVVQSEKAYLWVEYKEPEPYPFYRRSYYDPFWDPYWDLHWRRHFFYGRGLHRWH